MEHQPWLNLSRLLVVVRDYASDEVRFGGMQGVHQRIQLLGVKGGNCLGSTSFLLLSLLVVLLLPALAWMVLEGSVDEAVGPRLEEFNHSIVERVLVLLQPTSHVIGDSSRIVNYIRDKIYP